MKKSKFFAAALAATMFATAACGLVACDKDPGEIGIPSTNKPPVSQGTEYTVTFSGTNIAKTTTGGKLSGTMPTANAPSGQVFQGWAKSATATTPDITASNYTSYTFTGTATAVTLYPVFATQQGGNSEYTITLNAGTNGTCATSTLTTSGGKLASLPNATPNSGYSFDGWFTSATGGSQVYTSTTFTANDTIYAQYTFIGGGFEEPESDGELLVGGTRRMYLTDNTANIQAPIEGATATYEYYAMGVQLSAGDVVTFRIKGTVLAHHNTPAEGPRLFDTATRHGATWSQAAGAFTVKSNSTGSFDIYVRYYDTGEGNEEHPCWSIEFTDGGVDQLVPGGLYLVGEGFANAGWAPSTDCYIDPDEGLTITLSAGNKIKTCHSDSAGTGPVWDMGDNTKYKEVGGSYIDFSTLDSGMGNASVKSGTHTYKITYEDGMVVFTCLD